MTAALVAFLRARVRLIARVYAWYTRDFPGAVAITFGPLLLALVIGLALMALR